jgi:hypothetical protein
MPFQHLPLLIIIPTLGIASLGGEPRPPTNCVLGGSMVRNAING